MNLSNSIRKFWPFAELSMINFIKQMYKRFPALNKKKLYLTNMKLQKVTKKTVS